MRLAYSHSMTSSLRPATGAASGPRSSNRVVAVVYNPINVDRDEIRAAIDADPDSGSWAEPMWLETSEEDPGEGVTESAVEAKVDLVIAAGGDGTVRAVAESLRGSGIPLALLPSGTGNLLARNLDLTLDDVGHSIRSALGGIDRKIDLGVIDIRREDGSRDRHAFLVMAGLGVDAKMVEKTNAKLKKRVGWLAYVDAIARAMRDKSQLRLRYRLDEGATRRISAHTLIIGNCGSLPANMLLMPDALIDDGVFDIVFLRPEGFVGWVKIWLRVAWENGIIRRTRIGRTLMGEAKAIRALQYDTAASITAKFNRAEAIELDGDSFGKAVAIKSWIDPLALTVRLPADKTD
ncbi:MAG: diacylglycerol kinase [Glaciihabitans sp.]|nr:diacylglycerol kinase [Glaciihabitans sp.]MDQ1571445.1 diacylglycerol kinase [Actinomycetota bacterium]